MKIQRQKIKLLAAAAALTLGSGFALHAQAAEPGKLLIWINGDKGYNGLAKVGEEFTKKTGVQVVVEHPEDAPGKFQQAAAAGKGPDIWIWPHDRIGEWIAGGLLQTVTPGKKVQADIDPLAWKAFTVGGKTWGYPLSIEAVALVYNKALVPNPPKTFEEIAALDKKLAAGGKKAILWDYNNTYFTWPLLAANGGYAFKLKADGTYDPADTGVNNAGALKGADLLAKYVKDGVMTKGAGYAEMEAGMAQGKVAMMINGPWSWDNLKKAKIDYGVAKIPTVAGKKAAPFVGVLGAMVSKASPNRDVAIEFIENHMLSVDGLKKINDDVPLGTPASKALYAELKANPNIQATMASAQDGAPMPNNPEMGRFWSSMQSALQNMTEGRQSPKEALDGAAKRITTK
ncbi:maltose/maltodextrin ABC transporter substrate-binding protein MalE [Piscinibacter gummiphilus]|uniref:Maltodextrin-binding protein n=1 Tax=Piscinibacter gummiphilus TaxID=946333 RepID=A0A1W6L4X3_9BURK|nr:maltose/maltodextrin ABC transporter substrate-binding protein MalE [Piscinibacter gummiphilus]ARN19188.1 maltose ABC transporter substrate-binding protein MalE [Piscinibacter gummiphilus]ATU63849.1 maltose/maltodextrin ABC transporter substrate-binding protein MalE [Piscinibacter gummiphilus]GLS93205.1 maltose ABC transporter substrate-binding protein MalE [Piscinibacter gummiphilus]